MDAIVVEGLEKTYGKDTRALDGIRFSVPEGEVFGLLGPNGAGKSTTVRILATLTSADAGRATVAGHDVATEAGAVRRTIGYVPQASGVDREATGAENLVLQGRLQGMRGPDLERRAAELLETFGLTDKADALVKTYSGGMKRRLDVAMGLVHRPQVLFLDEPTTGLDPEARAAMWEELERLAAAERLTILLTTHYLEEADRLARRVAIVSRGKVVVEGSPGGAQARASRRCRHGRARRADQRSRARRRARTRGRARRDAGRPPAPPPGRPGGAGRAGDPRGARRRRRRRRGGHGLEAVARRRLPPPHGARLPGRRRRARVKVVSQTLYLCGRVLRNLSRQPIWIVVMIVQPMFWLLLYSQLFRRITELPGFGTTSYIDYLTPGVAMMTAFFSGSWAGMGMIEDLDRGVLERFLATPASRGAIVFGRILESAIVATLQALLILLTGILLGATNGGAVGWFVILLASFLTAAGFAGLSHGIALRTRQEATMIAVAQFIGLPLLFFSSLLIARALIPSWMQDLSLLNPVEWAVRSARGEALPGTDWGEMGAFLLLLAAFVGLTTSFATWSFRSYQRTL